MLLTTRESRRWRRAAIAALALLIAAFAWFARAGFPHGGTALGLTLGFAALALILLLLVYGVRKRAYRSRLGRMETWLQSHVYLGLLSAVVVLLHSGFRFEDKLAVTAFVVLLLVVLTGLVGAILYTTVPRLLTEVESDLSPAESSDRLNQIAGSMARLAGGKSPAFQRIQGSLLAESNPGFLAGWRIVLTGRRRRGEESGVSGEGPAWQALLGRVERTEQEDLRRLLVLSRQHKELHLRLIYQQRYRNLLDAWLWLHLPLSLALLVLALAHGAAALYYRGLPGI
jgi:hypothetical protein